MFRKFALCFCYSAALLPGLWAQKFIDPSDIDLAAIVPPPPTDSSPSGRADLNTVLQVQADITFAQRMRARRVEEQSVFSFGKPVLGAWFNSKNLPQTSKLFDEIEQQTHPLIVKAKDIWKRPRPYDRDARVQPIINRSRSSCYPSGHVATAAIWSMILSAAFPDHAKAFSRQVREVMWCRVLGGVHYPSDTEAGLDLGHAMGKSILSNMAMKQALQTIRNETARYLNKSRAK